MSSNKKSKEDAETSNRRVTRSSKRNAEIPEKLPESLPRKKKVSVKKNSSISNLESDVCTPKSSGKRAKGGAKSVKSQPKISQPQEYYNTQQGTISGGKEKNKSARGRGKTRGSGSLRGRNAKGGRAVKKPAKSFYYWGRSPPTAQQLADIGAKEGCTYALTTKGKLGARNRAYIAESRATRAAEIAVANLYDSD